MPKLGRKRRLSIYWANLIREARNRASGRGTWYMFEDDLKSCAICGRQEDRLFDFVELTPVFTEVHEVDDPDMPNKYPKDCRWTYDLHPEGIDPNLPPDPSIVSIVRLIERFEGPATSRHDFVHHICHDHGGRMGTVLSDCITGLRVHLLPSPSPDYIAIRNWIQSRLLVAAYPVRFVWFLGWVQSDWLIQDVRWYLWHLCQRLCAPGT